MIASKLWTRGALTSLMIALPFSGCFCPNPPVSDGGTLECGPGTVEENGQCVPTGGDGDGDGDGGTGLECGPGTVPNQAGTQCVPDLDCPPGTTENNDGTACVPDCTGNFIYDEDLDMCACPAGLRPTADGSDCELDPALCGEGTVYDSASMSCIIVTPPLPSDDDVTGEDAVIVELEADKPVEVGGVVGPVDREDGPDIDTWIFEVAAPYTRIRIQLISFGLPNGAFLVNDLVTDDGDYFRAGIPRENRRAVRELVLPFAGQYAVQVTDLANISGGFIPVGGEDFTYQLNIEILDQVPATTIAADGTLLTGQHDSVDAYRVNDTVVAPSSIMVANLAASTVDPDCDTSQVLWYINGQGEYVEAGPDASCNVLALLPQPSGGLRMHVDYVARLNVNPIYDYALTVDVQDINAGPTPGTPLDGNTGGEDLTWYEVSLIENHVYRNRTQFPQSSTVDGVVLLVDPELNVLAQSNTVTIDGTTYQELRHYVDVGGSGTYYLVVAATNEAEPGQQPNNNLQMNLEDSEVAYNAVPVAGGAAVTNVEPKPTASDWDGPWTMVRVDTVADLVIATDNGVSFDSFRPLDMTPINGTIPEGDPLPPTVGTAVEGACNAATVQTINARGDYTFNLVAPTNDFTNAWGGCGFAGTDVYFRVPQQPAGTLMVMETLSEGDNAATDTRLGVIQTTDCVPSADACLAFDDDGGDGFRSFLTYTWAGDEGDLLVVIDSWAGNALDPGTLRMTIDFVDSAARVFQLAPGSRVLTKATGGDATGTFNHTAQALASPYNWETEVNNGPGTANPLPGVTLPLLDPLMQDNTVNPEEGVCNDAASSIGGSAIYVLALDATGDFLDGDNTDDCAAPGGSSGPDAHVTIPAQPAGTLMRVEVLAQGVNAGSDLTLGLINSCTVGTTCLAVDDNGGASPLPRLEYLWEGTEGDLTLIIDSWNDNFFGPELLAGDTYVQVEFITLPTPPEPWNGFTAGADFDYWEIVVTEAGGLTVTVTDGPLGIDPGVVTLTISDGTNELTETLEGFLNLSTTAFVMPGTYYAVVGSGDDGPPGDYNVSWVLDPNQQPPPTCDMPAPIAGAGAYSGDTTLGSNGWEPSTSECIQSAFGDTAAAYANTPDTFYGVTIPAGGTLVAEVTSDTLDAVVALLGSCGDTCGLVAVDETFPFFGPATETLAYTNEGNSPLDAVLVVTGWNGSRGPYSLNVTILDTVCFPGETRCNNDGDLEVCNNVGSGFDASDCPGGCTYDSFEQIASCNAYCSGDTGRPDAICDGNGNVSVCSADQTRYEDGEVCDIACAEVGDSALCTFGVCANPGLTTCADEDLGGFGIVPVARTCGGAAEYEDVLSCAYGCNGTGDGCAVAMLTPVAVPPTTDGVCQGTDLCAVQTPTSTEDFEGGVLPAGWTVGGDVGWDIDTVEFNSGANSLVNGVIGNNQTSTASYDVTLAGPGAVSFFYKTSTETNFDELVFYIDGDLQDAWSGTIDWTEATFPLAAGTHTLTWAYEKDFSGTGGTDQVWIDDVTISDCTAGDINGGVNPGDLVATSSTFDIVFDGSLVNDGGECVDAAGEDFTFRLAPMVAGTQVRVSASGLDTVVGIQDGCNTSTCLFGPQDGGGTTESFIYTYDGTEVEPHVLIDAYSATGAGTVTVEVEYILSPAPICDAVDNTCDTGTNTATVCSADQTTWSSQYCGANGCNVAGTGCLNLGDSCADATDMTGFGDDWSFTFDLSGLTDQINGSCDSGFSNPLEGVFSVTAPADGTMTVYAGPYDSVIQVFGTTCGVEVDCVDDGISGGETTSIAVTGGNTYYFAVGPYGAPDVSATEVTYSFVAD